jgi:IclR family acetate operon transcriptional repressor
LRALERVVAILEHVARDPRPAGPARIAETTGLSLSTVSRLMRQLADEGLLQRSERDATYVLGDRLLLLVQGSLAGADPVDRVGPLLRQVRDATGETTSLHRRRNNARVCIAKADSPHDVRRVISVGESLPLHGTAGGEVLLAGALEAGGEDAVDGLEDPELRARLDKIVQTGWALNSDSYQPGVTGLAVAVRYRGRTVAVLTVAGPSFRFSEKVALSHLPLVTQAADLIGSLLGPTLA